MKNNVFSQTVQQHLCISCSACEVVCPTKAIKMTFDKGHHQPLVLDDLCTDCGICLKICPSYHVDLKNKSVDTLFYQSDGDSYIVQAKNKDILKNSTSGGFITQLILHLISENVYNKAAVLHIDDFNNLNPYIDIKQSVDDIKKAAKSKYVPVSVAKILAYIQENKNEKVIIVGTPCQFYAIQSFIKLKKLNIDNYLFIGLFCDKVLNVNIYRYFEYRFGKFLAFEFRSKEKDGWPGHTKLIFKQNFKFVDKDVRMNMKQFFQMNRCRVCIDKLNNLADISCGDCYIEKDTDMTEGYSNIIVKTKKGAEAFGLVKDLFISQAINTQEILDTQELYNKKSNLVRAVKLYPTMYVNAPEMQDSFDYELEKKDYKRLMLGANMIDKKSYKELDAIIYQKVPIFTQIKRYIKKLIGYKQK